MKQIVFVMLALTLAVSCAPAPTPAPTAAPPMLVAPTRVLSTPILQSPAATATTVLPNLPTLPPPLAEVDFPSQAINYPSDWPQEIRYPSSFKLVGAASGTMPDGKTKGWSAKLVYSGRPEDASTDLSSFFVARGWRIVEATQLDSDGRHLFLQRNSNSQRGSILIGPDVAKSGLAKLLVTIFL